MGVTGATPAIPRPTVLKIVVATSLSSLLLGGAIHSRLAQEQTEECRPTTAAADAPDAARRALDEATLYGSPSLWLAHPTFYPATGGNKGYFSYLSVLKADDVELSVLLVSDSDVGDVDIQPGAALAGVQRVPVSVPSAGCWTLALSVPNRAPLVVTIEVR